MHASANRRHRAELRKLVGMSGEMNYQPRRRQLIKAIMFRRSLKASSPPVLSAGECARVRSAIHPSSRDARDSSAALPDHYEGRPARRALVAAPYRRAGRDRFLVRPLIWEPIRTLAPRGRHEGRPLARFHGAAHAALGRLAPDPTRVGMDPACGGGGQRAQARQVAAASHTCFSVLSLTFPRVMPVVDIGLVPKRMLKLRVPRQHLADAVGAPTDLLRRYALVSGVNEARKLHLRRQAHR